MLSGVFMTVSVSRRLTAETLGTLLLVATVVGSGIMAENLAEGNLAIALLANAIATGAILVVLILMFASISGARDPRARRSRLRPGRACRRGGRGLAAPLVTNRDDR
jgi:hypothetical protein